MVPCQEVRVVRIQVVRGSAPNPLNATGIQRGLEHIGHFQRDLGLNLEYVFQLTSICLGPQVLIAIRVSLAATVDDWLASYFNDEG